MKDQEEEVRSTNEEGEGFEEEEEEESFDKTRDSNSINSSNEGMYSKEDGGREEEREGA